MIEFLKAVGIAIAAVIMLEYCAKLIKDINDDLEDFIK